MSLKCLNKAAHIERRHFSTKVLCHGVITNHCPNTLFLPQRKGHVGWHFVNHLLQLLEYKACCRLRSLMVSLFVCHCTPLIPSRSNKAAMYHIASHITWVNPQGSKRLGTKMTSPPATIKCESASS